MAVNRTASLLFICDGSVDKSSRMNSESAKCSKTDWRVLHSADEQ